MNASALVVHRLEKGLSVEAAATAMGIARGTLVRAEAGEGVWPGSAKKIADFYELRVTDLWHVNGSGELVPREAVA